MPRACSLDSLCPQQNMVYLQQRDGFLTSKLVLFTTEHDLFKSKLALFTTEHGLFISRLALFTTEHGLFISRLALLTTWIGIFRRRVSMFTSNLDMFATRLDMFTTRLHVVVQYVISYYFFHISPGNPLYYCHCDLMTHSTVHNVHYYL